MIEKYFIAMFSYTKVATPSGGIEKKYNYIVDIEPTRQVISPRDMEHDPNGYLSVEQRDWLYENMVDEWAAAIVPVGSKLRYLALFASERDAMLFHLFWIG